MTLTEAQKRAMDHEAVIDLMRAARNFSMLTGLIMEKLQKNQGATACRSTRAASRLFLNGDSGSSDIIWTTGPTVLNLISQSR